MTEYKSRRQKFREYTLPERRTAAAFVRGLRKIPGIRRVSTGNFRCTLYDSFDGRAYGDGVLLVWVDRQAGGMLQAMSAGNTIVLWQQPMACPYSVGAKLEPMCNWATERLQHMMHAHQHG